MAAAAMVRGALMIGAARGGSRKGHHHAEEEDVVGGLVVKPRAPPAAGAGGPKPPPLSRDHSRETDDESVTVCSSSLSSCSEPATLSGSLLSAASSTTSASGGSSRARGGGAGRSSDPLGASTHSEASVGTDLGSTSCPDIPLLNRVSSSPPALPSTPTNGGGMRCEVVRPLSLEKPAHRRTRSAQDIRAHYACRLGIRDPRAERRVLMMGHWRHASCLPEGARPVLEKLKGGGREPEFYGGFLRLMRRQPPAAGVEGAGAAASAGVGVQSQQQQQEQQQQEQQQVMPMASPPQQSPPGQPCPACQCQQLQQQQQQRSGMGVVAGGVRRRVSYDDLPAMGAGAQGPRSAAIAVPTQGQGHGHVEYHHGIEEGTGAIIEEDARSEASSASSGSSSSILVGSFALSCCSCSPPPSALGAAISPPAPHNLRNGRRVGGLKKQQPRSRSRSASLGTSFSSPASTPKAQAAAAAGSSSSGGRRLCFVEEVAVVHIPSHREYSRRVKGQYWASPEEIYEMACRNLVEYEAEGYAWERALEEDQLFWCPDSGEYVHPAHLAGLDQQQM